MISSDEPDFFLPPAVAEAMATADGEAWMLRKLRSIVGEAAA